jgi:hypothetical protein
MGHIVMKKIAAISGMALALVISANAAQAADYDAEQAIRDLVVSGEIDQWTGYTFLTNANGDTNPENDDYISSGVSGRLSLPLGDMLSVQMDGDLEYTSNSFDDDGSDDTFQHSFQFGTHFSARDPSRGLIGIFGAAGLGTGDDSDNDSKKFFVAVGGEAQSYFGDKTLYLQGGFIDSRDDGGSENDALNNAFFVRGVARWFLTPDSRLQAEVSYVDGDRDNDDGDDNEGETIIEWGGRYDWVLPGLPLIGDTPIYVGYRGAYFENGDDLAEYTEHTVMVGTVYHFGGSSRQEFDRTGATLNLPNFGRWVWSGEALD